jgi:flagellar hook-basal body complex protein FliE
MAFIEPSQALGDIVKLVRTNPMHLAGEGEAPAASVAGETEKSFADILMGAIGNVNESQLNAMNLSQKMVTDPRSVNVEDVTIALADANLTLSMTKAVVDRALAAYREIINIR